MYMVYLSTYSSVVGRFAEMRTFLFFFFSSWLFFSFSIYLSNHFLFLLTYSNEFNISIFVNDLNVWTSLISVSFSSFFFPPNIVDSNNRCLSHVCSSYAATHANITDVDNNENNTYLLTIRHTRELKS
jgi:hypothetical protein